jgi:hypothetical protein
MTALDTGFQHPNHPSQIFKGKSPIATRERSCPRVAGKLHCEPCSGPHSRPQALNQDLNVAQAANRDLHSARAVDRDLGAATTERRRWSRRGHPSNELVGTAWDAQISRRQGAGGQRKGLQQLGRTHINTNRHTQTHTTWLRRRRSTATRWRSAW